MQAANLITTFPLYARDEDCTHNRHWCRNKSLFVQPVPLTRLPPWIIEEPGVGTATVWVHNRSTDTWLDITALITTATATVDAVDYLYYNWTSFSAVTDAEEYASKGSGLLGDKNWTIFSASCAQLQMVIDVGESNTWYSELFYVKDDLPEDHGGVTPDDSTGCILLDFSDDVKVGAIPYSGITFSQRVFLPCDIGQPSYEITLDGTEDGDRIQSPSFRRTIKRWSTTLPVPEYMTDALAIMGIHSTKLLADQYNITTPIHEVAITTDWQTFGPHLSNTTLTFRRDFVRKYNC